MNTGGDREVLLQRLQKELRLLVQLKDTDGVELHTYFETLPSPEEEPGYYMAVRQPMTFALLSQRLGEYTSAQGFVNDLALIPWNTKTYHMDYAPQYRQADLLEGYLRNICVGNLRKNYPNLIYPELKPVLDENAKLEFRKIFPSKSDQSPAVSQPYNMNMQREFVQNVPTPPRVGTTFVMDTQMQNSRRSTSSSIQPSELSTPTTKPRQGTKKKIHIKRGRPPVIDLPYVQRIKNIFKMLRKEVDAAGEPLTLTFEKLPSKVDTPEYYQIINRPISLEDIRKKVKTRKYKDFKTFCDEMNLMINNYKQYYANNALYLKKGSLLAKNFKIMVDNELSKPDEDYVPEGELKYPLEQLVSRDQIYKIGDWVLLKNANKGAKPTVGQIFKIWKTSDGSQWLNACWYIRPEQTVHRHDRLFYKTEVVKTGQYRDHSVNEIIERCYVVHFTRYQRGDPVLDYDVPLFLCEFRYNENDKAFNKIRTWRACLPEETRDKEENTIPVNGRKFFKYPSPIKHLLPANARIGDPIPFATVKASNAPPLVGAVYMGPVMEKDDLGEYSTSLDCPRYVIRPGDPSEDGVIDHVMGTLTTSHSTANSLPRASRPNTKFISLKQENMVGYSMTEPTSVAQSFVTSKPKIDKPDKESKLIPEQASQSRKQIVKKRTLASYISGIEEQPEYDLTSVITKFRNKMSKHMVGQIQIDTPGAFVMPISIKHDADGLRTIDEKNQLRLQNTENLVNPAGSILWFKGPSVHVQERQLDSQSKELCVPLNRWLRKSKLEYEEIDDINSDIAQNTVLETEKCDEPDDGIMLPNASVIGLRPSANYLAYKLYHHRGS